VLVVLIESCSFIACFIPGAALWRPTDDPSHQDLLSAEAAAIQAAVAELFWQHPGICLYLLEDTMRQLHDYPDLAICSAPLLLDMMSSALNTESSSVLKASAVRALQLQQHRDRLFCFVTTCVKAVTDQRRDKDWRTVRMVVKTYSIATQLCLQLLLGCKGREGVPLQHESSSSSRSTSSSKVADVSTSCSISLAPGTDQSSNSVDSSACRLWCALLSRCVLLPAWMLVSVSEVESCTVAEERNLLELCAVMLPEWRPCIAALVEAMVACSHASESSSSSSSAAAAAAAYVMQHLQEEQAELLLKLDGVCNSVQQLLGAQPAQETAPRAAALTARTQQHRLLEQQHADTSSSTVNEAATGANQQHAPTAACCRELDMTAAAINAVEGTASAAASKRDLRWLNDFPTEVVVFATTVWSFLPVKQCCNNQYCLKFAGCTEQELVKGKSRVCGGCRLARYCSPECQKCHWGAGHKLLCKLIQTEVA
jgi:hypothetical protein